MPDGGLQAFLSSDSMFRPHISLEYTYFDTQKSLKTDFCLVHAENSSRKTSCWSKTNKSTEQNPALLTAHYTCKQTKCRMDFWKTGLTGRYGIWTTRPSSADCICWAHEHTGISTKRRNLIQISRKKIVQRCQGCHNPGEKHQHEVFLKVVTRNLQLHVCPVV